MIEMIYKQSEQEEYTTAAHLIIITLIYTIKAINQGLHIENPVKLREYMMTNFKDAAIVGVYFKHDAWKQTIVKHHCMKSIKKICWNCVNDKHTN